MAIKWNHKMYSTWKWELAFLTIVKCAYPPFWGLRVAVADGGRHDELLYDNYFDITQCLFGHTYVCRIYLVACYFLFHRKMLPFSEIMTIWTQFQGGKSKCFRGFEAMNLVRYKISHISVNNHPILMILAPLCLFQCTLSNQNRFRFKIETL